LSVDIKVEGDVIADGDIYIGGSVKGRVVARKLTVGEGASISGIVEAETVIIVGSVSGKLTANTVTIKRTAHVSADITHIHLTIESGATFEGHSRHVASIQPAAAPIATPQVSGGVPRPALTHAEFEAA